MPLLTTRRHSPADLAAWLDWAEEDRLYARLHGARLDRLADRAAATILDYADSYISVSWGKDSVVLAHIAATRAPHIPLWWARCVDGHEQPDSPAVRDAFLAAYPHVDYHEWLYSWSVPLRPEPGWDDPAHHQDVLADMTRHVGRRHITGVRAAESAERRQSGRHGVSTPHTCRPLLWWRHSDIWAYLERHDLPVHPAYGMTWGGQISRDDVRVHCLRTRGGDHAGRAEWEDHYYPEIPKMSSDMC